MKALKKSVAFVLAVLMIFSSMSALGFAAMDDGNRDSIAVTSNFLRYDEETDTWVPATKAARGDKVKVQLTMQTNFAVGTMDLLWEFTKSNLTVDTTVHTANGAMYNDVANTAAGTVTGDHGYTGNLMDICVDGGATNFNIQWLVSDGLISQAFADEYGFIHHSIAGEFKNYLTICQVLDGKAWMYEYYFVVNDKATGEGKFFLEPATVQDNGANYMGFVTFMRAIEDGVSTTDETEEMYNWMPGPVKDHLTLNHSSITFDNKVKFDAGEGTISGKSEYTGYIGAPLSDIEGFAVPKAAQSGKNFLGWSLDGTTALTEDEVKAFTVDYEEVTLTALYEDADATYVQNIYTMGTDGEYGVASPSDADASTGDKVNASDYSVPDGFTLDEEKSTMEDVTVTSDGKATVDIYLKRNTYEIAFGDSKETLYYEETYTAPEGPKITGQKFTGWLGSDGTTLLAGQTETVGLAGVTYTAQYVSAETKVAIKVKYNDLANGGAEKIVDVATVDTIAGYTVALSDTKEGTDDENLTTNYLISKLPGIEHYEYDAENTTASVTAAEDGTSVLYAVYKPLTYSATFEGAQSFKDVAYYTEIKVPAGPGVAGKTFTGWLGSDGSTPAVGSTFNIAGDVTYTAQYDDIVYTATYSYTGETPEDAPKYEATTGVKDELVELPEVEPITGWTFNGWTVSGATLKDGKYYYNTSNVTVKGSWTHEIYTATYYIDGEEYDYQEYYYSDMIEVLDNPDESALPAGYSFAYWDCGYASMPAENIEIHAELNIKQYTVTIVLPEGYDSVTYSVDHGTKITADDLAEYQDLEGWDWKQWTVARNPITLPYTVTGNAAIVFDGERVKSDLYFWANEDDYNAYFEDDTTVVPVAKHEDIEFEAAIHTYVPVAPEVEGQYFVCWDSEVTTMDAYDMHFYAIYDVESYNVTWKIDDETIPESYEYGEALNIPVRTKDGYTLTGWTNLPKGTTTMPDIGDSNAETKASIEYIAVWEANTYNAVFNANGGAWGEETTKTVPTKFGEDIIAPANPSRAGYTFGGWEPTVGKMDSVNGKTFNATWNPDGNTPYTVNVYTMNTEGGYDLDAKPFTAETDSKVTYTPEITEGFKLNANSVTEGTVTADGKLVLNVWIDRETYTLTTVVGNKTTETPYLFGAAVAVETPSQVGYSFAWDAEVPATMPAKNVTLNGTFTPLEYDLIYMVDGKQHSSEKVTFGTPVTVIDPLTQEGYTFIGWDREGTFNMPAETVTISGSWKINSYKVTYKVDGNVVHETTAEYNSKVDLYDYTPEEGYTFSGWDKEDGFTMPASEVIVNGTTSKITVTVTYEFRGDVPADYPVPASVPATYGESIKKYAIYDGNDLVTGYVSTLVGARGSVYDEETGQEYVGTEDITIVYAWNRVPVLVTTTYTGDVPAGYETTEDWTKQYNDTFTLTTPAEEGYTFKGWTVNGAEYDAETGIVTIGTTDVTITGTWEINKYDVIYMVGDGEYTRFKDVAFGTPVTVLDDLKEDGKVFSGWTIDGADAEDFTMPAHDVTIVGSWTTNNYTVTYYMGEADSTVHYTYTGAYGAQYNIPLDPEKEGHKFLGWANVADDAAAGLPVAGTLVNVPLNGAEYYATWEKLSYKLVYMAGTNAQFTDGTTQQSFDVPYGTPKAEWKAPALELTRPGYTFGGWNLDAAPATMGAGRVNVTAIWNAIPYTVTWINGDAEPVVDDYTYGIEIIAPELEEREGWSFEGWLEADGETYFNDGDTMGEKSLVYTAQWVGEENIEYTIYRYFAPLEGEEWMDAAEAEAKYGKPGTTVKTGTAGDPVAVDTAAEAVDGFYIDEESSILSTTIEGDGTAKLVIYYLRDTVKVTVKDPDGETYYDSEVDFEEQITVPDPEKEGFDFIKWVDEDGNTVTFPMPAPSDDIVIKPVFEAKKYTITFVDDNGDVIEAAKEVEFGSTIVAPADPKKDGYKFAYWRDAETKAIMPATMPAKNATYEAFYTAGEDTTYYIEVYMMDTSGEYTMASRTVATGTTGADISITPGTIKGCEYDATLSVLTGKITADGNATLKVYYARKNYTVTFNAGDGVFADDAKVVGPTNVLYGAAIPVPAAPTREGYTFAGWDSEVPAAMPAENKTFTATWTEAEYTITYIVNGDVYDTDSYAFGATIEAPKDPVVDGMTFIKWNPVVPSTMPAKNLVIVAQFEVSVYKATFLVDGVVYEQFMVGHGDEIPVPAEDPKKDFYTFTGWTGIPDDGRMPAIDIEITATFESVPVKLIPMEGSTTVIDRDTKAITGIGRYATEAKLRSTFLDVEGDGYFMVTPSKKTACGTGTVIQLYDNATGLPVEGETYTIVVYGDLNGDSKIGTDDYSIAKAEYDMYTFWSDPSSSEYDFYKTMAADFDGDKFINIGEAADIERFALGTVDIDQVEGKIIYLY